MEICVGVTLDIRCVMLHMTVAAASYSSCATACALRCWRSVCRVKSSRCDIQQLTMTDRLLTCLYSRSKLVSNKHRCWHPPNCRCHRKATAMKSGVVNWHYNSSLVAKRALPIVLLWLWPPEWRFIMCYLCKNVCAGEWRGRALKLQDRNGKDRSSGVESGGPNKGWHSWTLSAEVE